MKFLSKIIISTALVSTFSSAGLVDAISVIINNEPITLYEVYKYANKFKISTKESLNLLVRQKLEDAQIRNLHINVDSFEIDKYIKNLAAKNGISEFQFYEMLKSKNINEEDYRKDVKKKIEQEKLYRKIIATKHIKIEPSSLKKYYEANKSQFIRANNFTAAVYQGPNKSSLEKISKNPLLSMPGVEVKEEKFKSGNMDTKLEGLFDQTKSGEFTPVFKMGDHFTMFYLKEKGGIKTIPFEKVKNYIYSTLSSEKEKQAINDYFEKLKSVANIKVLRKPNS